PKHPGTLAFWIMLTPIGFHKRPDTILSLLHKRFLVQTRFHILGLFFANLFPISCPPALLHSQFHFHDLYKALKSPMWSKIAKIPDIGQGFLADRTINPQAVQ